MALAWVLNNKAVTTALIGASNVKQIKENIESLNNLDFSKSELKEINKKAKDGNINKWARSSSY
jgi:L-glyceraldehyde 3-phosphate reductase